MFGIGVALLVLTFAGIAFGWPPYLAGFAGGFLGSGYRAMRGWPTRASGRQQALGYTALAIVTAVVAFIIYQDMTDDPDLGFRETTPASPPVKVAGGTTPSGGTWTLEAYRNADGRVCTRSHDRPPPPPSTVEPTGVGFVVRSGGGGAGCGTSLPLSISGHGDDGQRIFVGVAPLTARAVRLLRCDGSVRSVVPNRRPDFDRSFFGFAFSTGTARRIIVIGSTGDKIAQEDLTKFDECKASPRPER